MYKFKAKDKFRIPGRGIVYTGSMTAKKSEEIVSEKIIIEYKGLDIEVICRGLEKFSKL